LKSILALIGGGDRDAVIMQTAYAVAIPLAARIDFLHIHVSAGIAMRYDRHAHFVVGAEIKSTLDYFNTRAGTFSEVAKNHALEFHKKLQEIRLKDDVAEENSVAVSFREENDTSIEALIAEAWNCDLVVIGRARQTQGLSPDTLEQLVKQCRRPVLVAAAAAPRALPGTVMVCWDNSEIVNRVVFAATPLLMNANRLVFVNVGNDQSVSRAVDKLGIQLKQTSASPEVRIISKKTSRVADALAAAAGDCGADLVVMGAYGGSWFRRLIFGSRTDEALASIDKPIMLMH
jgi:nucleotide-binding universal stress UspA family protein